MSGGRPGSPKNALRAHPAEEHYDHMRPLIGVTMGDPGGIGPEIAVKALAGGCVREQCRPLVVGCPAAISAAADRVGAPTAMHVIDAVSKARHEEGVIDVLPSQEAALGEWALGRPTAAGGAAAFAAVRTATDLALAGDIDAMVTGPISKEALHMAGHRLPGHTEILAHLTGVDADQVAMMLVEGDVRVVHVSTHLSLRDACEQVKQERILAVVRLGADACRTLGVAEPRIAVAGLNPHCAEGGLFGDEEEREIIPAIERAWQMGLDVDGPVPADTLFVKAAGGEYDVCVAMYHDQGHIPLKLLGFRWDRERGALGVARGVNVTLGLPIIRTSVDHGTAFDQAGKGTASEESLLNAIELAAQMAGAGKGTDQ